MRFSKMTGCAVLLAVMFTSAQSDFNYQDVAKIESEVMHVLDDYMTAWNNKDIEAWERTFHFPHFRLASGEMKILEKPGLQDASQIWKSSIESDWHHSGWDHRRIIHLSDDKVHVDTKFSRYRSDGTVIRSYKSLYVVTKEDGRWGVKLRSSFAK